MEKKLRLHPKAEEELNQSYDWHNQNRSDSGDDFLLSVNEKLEQIIENPESRSADSDGVRWASVAKFPYHIYYLFRTLIVWILAIWHNSRKTRRMERKSQRSELNTHLRKLSLALLFSKQTS